MPAGPADEDNPTRRSQQRAQRMIALREQGHSLIEIARRFGVSRERVRQILHANGGPEPLVVSEARRRRVKQQTEARIDELLGLWRAGAQPAAAARSLGLPAAACRRAIARAATDVDAAARKASIAGARRVVETYTDRDIIEGLTFVAAHLGRVPSAKEYGALARELERPSLATVLNRMGGWSSAVWAAGLSPAATSARTRARRWTAEACWAALRRVVMETGHVPTVAAYDRYAANHADLPSSATVRNRLGRWSAITTRLTAERE